MLELGLLYLDVLNLEEGFSPSSMLPHQDSLHNLYAPSQPGNLKISSCTIHPYLFFPSQTPQGVRKK